MEHQLGGLELTEYFGKLVISIQSPTPRGARRT
jgi:hypothetical protein